MKWICSTPSKPQYFDSKIQDHIRFYREFNEEAMVSQMGDSNDRKVLWDDDGFGESTRMVLDE